MNDSHSSDRERESSRRFVEHLAEHYRPKPLAPAQRARFDAGLRERIERRRARAWMPSLAGAAAALALAWWVWPVAAPLPQADLPQAALPQAGIELAALDTDWEAEVLLADADPKLVEEEYLPDEYVVIAFAFIDGM